MSDKQKFFLTTPIYYVNARPHIGHAYTTLVADTIARRHRLLGQPIGEDGFKPTYFLTGTDEHGQKVERSAAAAGIPPQQFTDEVSETFRKLWQRMGITNNDFIRTTDERHKCGVQKLWKLLEDRGAIYLSTYTGQYSVGEEMFVDGPPGTIGPDGKPTETVTEENYFFRLSDYQLPLINLIESGELNIQPESSRNEVLSFLRGNTSAALNSNPISGSKAVVLSNSCDAADSDINTTNSLNAVILSDGGEAAESKDPCISPEAPQISSESTTSYSAAGIPYVPGAIKDLSISRTSFKWGIPVPGNEKHVIYVWLDALANYMTAIGYGSDDPAEQKKFETYWPADLHLVGKEITRFHCVYWPAFLLALNPKLQHKSDEPTPQLSFEEHREWAREWLPKSIVANGWLLFDESKMSKSKGNVVRTETILDAFGTEVYAKQFPDSTKHEQDLFATDVLRYFLLREIPFGHDGSFSFDAMITRYNADLANGYGNLVSRTLSLIQQNLPNGIESISQTRLDGTSFVQEAITQLSRHEPSFIGTGITAFITEISLLVGHVDRYISSHMPWKLAKEPGDAARQQLVEVLYTAAESIRLLTAYLYPFLPYSSAAVWAQLGLGDIQLASDNGELRTLSWGGLKPGTKLGPLSPIFPRADKGLAQIMTDIEASNTPKPAPSKFVDERTVNTEPSSTETTDPGAAPRTAAFVTPNPGATVAGSHAILTERPANLSHTEAPASGLFANAAAQSDIPDTAQIAIDDFVKIDLRVARITLAERIPKADKLLRLEVDLGYEKRQILSGIAEWYTPEELLGRRIVVIANLAPRKMRGLESHGMLLAASEGENGKPILATFAEDIALGSRLR